MRVRSRFGLGESLLIQESYDPNWRAEANGQLLPIRPDPLGQMLVETPPGEYEVRLHFPMPLENRIGAGIMALSGLAALLLLLGDSRWRLWSNPQN